MGLRVTWNGSEIGLGMGLGHHALLLRSFIILHSPALSLSCTSVPINQNCLVDAA